MGEDFSGSVGSFRINHTIEIWIDEQADIFFVQNDVGSSRQTMDFVVDPSLAHLNEETGPPAVDAPQEFGIRNALKRTNRRNP